MKEYFYPRDFLLITAGSLFIASAINTFIAPQDFAFGGVSGMAVIARALINAPLWATNLVLNIPLFLLSIKVKGVPFAVKSLIATGQISFFLFLTEGLQHIHSDAVVAAIFGGIMMGSGVGTLICGGGSSGGTDMAACIMKAKFKLPLWISIAIIDGAVIISGVALFGFNKALYSMMLVFCLAKSVGIVDKNLIALLDKIPIRRQMAKYSAAIKTTLTLSLIIAVLLISTGLMLIQ